MKRLILIISTTLSISACTSTPENFAPDLTRGLVAHWPMDQQDVDREVIKDRLGNFHGKRFGGVRLAKGVVGEAIEFNGKDGYVSFGNILNDVFTNVSTENGLIGSLEEAAENWKQAFSLNSYGNKFSISLWVNHTKPGQQSNILLKSGHTHCRPQKNERMLSISAGNQGRGDNAISFGVQGLTVNSGGVYADPEVAVPTGQWTHFVVNYDEGVTNAKDRISIWLNGKAMALNSRGSKVFNLQPSPAELALGVTVSSNGVVCAFRSDQYYSGLVDDLRIYDRLVSDEEVQQLYNQGDHILLAGPLTNDDPWYDYESNAIAGTNKASTQINSSDGSPSPTINSQTTRPPVQSRENSSAATQSTRATTVSTPALPVTTTSINQAQSTASPNSSKATKPVAITELQQTLTEKDFTGCWQWSNGAVIKLDENYNAVLGHITGKWHKESSNTLRIEWMKFIDNMNLVANGKMANGLNNFGGPVTSERMSGDASRLEGTWKWGNDIVEFRKDGEAYLNSLPLGRWSEGKASDYQIKWEHYLQDTITFADKNNLEVKNFLRFPENDLNFPTSILLGELTATRKADCN